MPFISFSCLIAVARTSNTMLTRSGENGHPCLLPEFKEFQIFTVDYDFSCEFAINGLYYADVHSLYTHFDDSIYHE